MFFASGLRSSEPSESVGRRSTSAVVSGKNGPPRGVARPPRSSAASWPWQRSSGDPNFHSHGNSNQKCLKSVFLQFPVRSQYSRDPYIPFMAGEPGSRLTDHEKATSLSLRKVWLPHFTLRDGGVVLKNNFAAICNVQYCRSSLIPSSSTANWWQQYPWWTSHKYSQSTARVASFSELV